MTATAEPNDPADRDFPPAGTVARLQTALVAYLQSAPSVDAERAVGDALDELAREARARRLHGERMLVAFKDVWHDMPEVGALGDRREQQRLLNRLVTRCIDAYYRHG